MTAPWKRPRPVDRHDADEECGQTLFQESDSTHRKARTSHSLNDHFFWRLCILSLCTAYSASYYCGVPFPTILPAAVTSTGQAVANRRTTVLAARENKRDLALGGAGGDAGEMGEFTEYRSQNNDSESRKKQKEREESEMKKYVEANESENENKKDNMEPTDSLCKECLKIVQRAQPIDLSFLDVSGGHKDHPHRGATYEDGKTFGYVHDETSLRQNPPPFRYELLEEELKRACSVRDNDYKMITEGKVHVDLQTARMEDEPPWPRVKLFCLLYTIDSYHDRIPAIRETWGQKCDGFMVASNRTDPILGTVNIPHLGEEVYDNIWQKVRSIWSYVYDHYYDKYDWFHIGGDDLYVIVENLRQYLESVEIRTAANGGINLPNGSETSQVPLYLGRRFAYSKARIYNTGGPGYTLNRAALKTLVALGMPKFFTHNRTSVEDVMVAKILGKFKVFPYDTKDRFGGERYMHFSPGRHYEMQMGREIPDWYPAFSGRTKDQSDYCSARSVSFHYLNTERMRRLHARLYGYCPAAVASPGEVK